MEYQHREAAATNTDSAIESPAFEQQTFFREHLQRADDGKIAIVGDDLSPVEMALLETEKRRRGSQSAVARETMRANKLTLELGKLKEIIPAAAKKQVVVDPALKYSDPDEYIKQTLAAQRENPYTEAFDTADQFAQQTVGVQTVQQAIAEHNQNYPTQQLTEEMLNLDLPPRLVQTFESGNMDPQDFLAQAADILYRPREVMNENIPVTPNLGEVGGSTSPTDTGSNEAAAANYANAVF